MIDFDPGAPPGIEFDKGPPIAIARHFAALPPIAPEHRDLFWYDWGPVFYRGRLNGSAKVIAIASDPGPTERLVGRDLVGDAGQRVQGFLTKLVLVNGFPHAVRPSKVSKALPLLSDPAQLAWRNRCYDLITDSRLEAIIAFGGNAQAALRLWDTAPDVPSFQIPHPSARDGADVAARWATDVDRRRPLGTNRLTTPPQHHQTLRRGPGPHHDLASPQVIGRRARVMSPTHGDAVVEKAGGLPDHEPQEQPPDPPRSQPCPTPTPLS